jgi:hypothetical protein
MMEDYRKPLVDPSRVKARMDAVGLKLNDLARQADVNYQLIQNLLNGQYKLKNPMWALALTKPLNASWEYLTGRSDNPTPATDDSSVKQSSKESASNGSGHPRIGIGQEGSSMLTEITVLLARMEGRLEATFGIRLDRIEKKLEEHDSRLEGLEGHLPRPQKGRRR